MWVVSQTSSSGRQGPVTTAACTWHLTGLAGSTLLSIDRRKERGKTEMEVERVPAGHGFC